MALVVSLRTSHHIIANCHSFIIPLSVSTQ